MLCKEAVDEGRTTLSLGMIIQTVVSAPTVGICVVVLAGISLTHWIACIFPKYLTNAIIYSYRAPEGIITFQSYRRICSISF